MSLIGRRYFITGVTGFLGRHLARDILIRGGYVAGIAQSESKVTALQALLPSVKVYVGTIENADLINRIVIEEKITHVVHCAALKHIRTCQEQPTACVRTNLIGTLNLVEACAGRDIDIVMISTDKANNPKCVYGMSKHIMERIAEEHGVRVFQGVNFLWSDGSVLDIWRRRHASGLPLEASEGIVRHFCDIAAVCVTILTSKEKRIVVDTAFRTSISDLMHGFCLAFGGKGEAKPRPVVYEKTDEKVDVKVTIEASVSDIVEILQTTRDGLLDLTAL